MVVTLVQRSQAYWLAYAVLLGMLGQESLWAQQPAGNPGDGSGNVASSLDDQLLNELTEGLDLGDNLGPLPGADSAKSPEPRPAKSEPTNTGPTNTGPTNTGPADSGPANAGPKQESEGEATRKGRNARLPGETQPGEPESGNSGDLRTDRSGQDNPLAHIVQEMRSVQDLLERANAGEQTQQKQQTIVAMLDELLQLQRQQSQPQQPNPNSQSQPQENSQQGGQPESQQGNQANQSGQPQSGEGNATPSSGNRSQSDQSDDPQQSTQRLETTQALREQSVDQLLEQYLQAEWGHLPQRERKMVINSFQEQFLPQYDALIRDYYRRLANSRSQGNSLGGSTAGSARN